jgi:hypothetical protein
MAAENIDGTVGGTGQYNTKIPSYADPADIQAALRLYHYGSDTIPANSGDILASSVAGYLKALQADIDAVDAKGIGSVYASTEPADPIDGFVWVKSDTSAPIVSGAIVPLQSSAPSNPSNGQLWVDNTSLTAPILKVYDLANTTWRSVSV